ncbi:O-methyltransferase [Nocardia amamiensis]|uniref:O-methyltransferase n=1 Tax=Nocardia amamiensis TaxID=404578 RepID=UPI00083503B4|nr:class I SAM-dependent methyltransferase [Nocardia amamiensis]
MIDEPAMVPPLVRSAQDAAQAAQFGMSCTNRTGALLRMLAASKPDGRILELGTGTGVGAAWLLSGMSQDARLDTVESDAVTCAIAQGVLMRDHRATLHCADAQGWLDSYYGTWFDLVFIDCRPGKFAQRGLLIDHLAPGGLYVVDDLLPQATWPNDHQPRVDRFLAEIGDEDGLHVARLSWDSGIIIAARAQV